MAFQLSSPACHPWQYPLLATVVTRCKLRAVFQHSHSREPGSLEAKASAFLTEPSTSPRPSLLVRDSLVPVTTQNVLTLEIPP